MITIALGVVLGLLLFPVVALFLLDLVLAGFITGFGKALRTQESSGSGYR
jgi:hypothetical protein